eukprot:349923-Chlamydomonas_euryale.AAC.5
MKTAHVALDAVRALSRMSVWDAWLVGLFHRRGVDRQAVHTLSFDASTIPLHLSSVHTPTAPSPPAVHKRPPPPDEPASSGVTRIASTCGSNK